MANDLQIAAQNKLGALPSNVRALVPQTGKINDELGAGITSGFSIVSYRGKVWRIKARGEERALLRPDRSPEAAIEVVIVRASPNLAKIFYVDGYEEGDNKPPDCWSVDAVKPDPASPKRQSDFCAGCPQNAWGSATRNGRTSKGKACSDSKRLAIVPGSDVNNEPYDGPMLLRVPPDSLGDVKAYSERLNAMGFPVFAVVTRISFDVNVPHPKLVFEEVRALTEEEAAVVLKHRTSEAVERMLNAAVDHVQTDGDVNAPTPTPNFTKTPDGKPMQQPQAAPAGFAPTPAPKPANSAALPPHDPVTGEIKQAPPANVTPLPTATNPQQASAQRVAEVEMQQTGDPNAAKRAELRKMGFPEDQIEALLGPEPKAEAAPDPRIAQLKAMGFDNAAIAKVIGTAPAAPVTSTGNGAAPANGTRKRRSKAEMEAERQAQQKPTQEPQASPLAASSPPQDAQPLNGEVLSPEPPQTVAGDDAPAGALPADFSDQLDKLLGGA